MSRSRKPARATPPVHGTGWPAAGTLLVLLGALAAAAVLVVLMPN